MQGERRMKTTTQTCQKPRSKTEIAGGEVETVEVLLNVPKPLMDFFEKSPKPAGTPQATAEEHMLAALIDGVTATLNDLDKQSRENIIHSLELDKILQ